MPLEPQFEPRAAPPGAGRYMIDNTRPQEILGELGRLEGFPVLDLLPFFRRSSVRPLHSREGHWNPAGHSLAAEEAYRFIRGHGLLGPDP